MMTVTVWSPCYLSLFCQVKKINALDQKKKVGKAGKATVITHVVTKPKKRVGEKLSYCFVNFYNNLVGNAVVYGQLTGSGWSKGG